MFDKQAIEALVGFASKYDVGIRLLLRLLDGTPEKIPLVVEKGLLVVRCGTASGGADEEVVSHVLRESPYPRRCFDGHARGGADFQCGTDPALVIGIRGPINRRQVGKAFLGVEQGAHLV